MQWRYSGLNFKEHPNSAASETLKSAVTFMRFLSRTLPSASRAFVKSNHSRLILTDGVRVRVRVVWLRSVWIVGFLFFVLFDWKKWRNPFKKSKVKLVQVWCNSCFFFCFWATFASDLFCIFRFVKPISFIQLQLLQVCGFEIYFFCTLYGIAWMLNLGKRSCIFTVDLRGAL